jgi:hypothetical protein
LVLLELVFTGALAGLFGALLGLGGGIFLVPALTLLFHVPLRLAVGTSLMCVVANSAGVAAVTSPGRGPDLSLAMRLEASTVFGAILGGLLAGHVSTAALSLLFAGVVYLTAVYTAAKARRKAGPGELEALFRTDYEPRHWAAGSAAALVAGAISGLLGVGGGFIKVPVMYALMEVPLGVATATSNFMVGITAAASFFVYYGRGEVRPLLAVPTALGVFGGALLGAYLLPRAKAQWLRWLLLGVMLLMGTKMLLQGLGG